LTVIDNYFLFYLHLHYKQEYDMQKRGEITWSRYKPTNR